MTRIHFIKVKLALNNAITRCDENKVNNLKELEINKHTKPMIHVKNLKAKTKQKKET